MASLLGGRNQAPLQHAQVIRAQSIFVALDNSVNVRYESGSWTRFQVVPATPEEAEYGEIVFSEDLFPGANIANANASLSMRAAAAHELAHYYRWIDMRELNGDELKHIDEAETSLEAAQRFANELTTTEVLQLIADAAERLRLYRSQLAGDVA